MNDNAFTTFGNVLKNERVKRGWTRIELYIKVNQLSSKKQYRIRLNDIDAPESKQAFGNKSKENLKNYIYQKDVVIDYESTDRYGRILGTIYYQNKDINLQQVKDGYAWVYKQYSNKQNYIKAEREARSSKKGLWRDNNPAEPWEYRKQKKEKNESFNWKSK